MEKKGRGGRRRIIRSKIEIITNKVIRDFSEAIGLARNSAKAFYRWRNSYAKLGVGGGEHGSTVDPGVVS